MPKLITLKTHADNRGKLTVIEKDLGFEIARVFYIYDSNQTRGGHGHYKTRMALVALGGPIKISGQTPAHDFLFELTSPDQALILEPEDWHEMEMSDNSVLLVLASQQYSKEDYFFDKYRL